MTAPLCAGCGSESAHVTPLDWDQDRQAYWVCMACGLRWVPKVEVLDVSMMTAEIRRVAHVACASLSPEEHHEDCPVRHGASADCVWPIGVCVPDDFFARISYYQKLSENQA
jgi:hypothetical protein